MYKAQIQWILVAVAWKLQPVQSFSFITQNEPIRRQVPIQLPSTSCGISSEQELEDTSEQELEDTISSMRNATSRRSWLIQSMCTFPTMLMLHSQPSFAAKNCEFDAVMMCNTIPFRTKAYSLKEYTNSIVVSKDTNVSPKEAYEVLAETIAPILTTRQSDKDQQQQHPNRNRALDVGAGAGVSTQTLYEMGYTNLDAVDWSCSAWNDNVVSCPPSVKFYEMDDERFFASQKGNGQSPKYQIIVYNFAINLDKAIRVAKEYLDPALENNARLLAPANAQKDYWYKQTYYLINGQGEIVWNSKPDVGAWSVQFQPDVTSETCQGIWCPPYNGFVRQT